MLCSPNHRSSSNQTVDMTRGSSMYERNPHKLPRTRVGRTHLFILPNVMQETTVAMHRCCPAAASSPGYAMDFYSEGGVFERGRPSGWQLQEYRNPADVRRATREQGHPVAMANTSAYVHPMLAHGLPCIPHRVGADGEYGPAKSSGPNSSGADAEVRRRHATDTPPCCE